MYGNDNENFQYEDEIDDELGLFQDDFEKYNLKWIRILRNKSIRKILKVTSLHKLAYKQVNNRKFPPLIRRILKKK